MRLGPGGGTADTTVSKTVAERCAGSNPAPGTTNLKRLPSGSRFSSGASWRTEPFSVGSELADGAVFRCRPRPSPPRLSHRPHSPVSLFRNSAQQTPRDRHRARLSLPGRDRDAGVARVFPGGESAKGRRAIVSAKGASISRSLLHRIGPFGNKTRKGKGHLLPEHEPAPLPSPSAPKKNGPRRPVDRQGALRASAQS